MPPISRIGGIFCPLSVHFLPPIFQKGGIFCPIFFGGSVEKSSFPHDFHRVFHSLFSAEVYKDHTAFPPEDWPPVACWGLLSFETSTSVCRRPMARCCSLYGRARNSSSISSSSGDISWVGSFFMPWGASWPVSRYSTEQPRHSQIGTISFEGGSVFRVFQLFTVLVPIPIFWQRAYDVMLFCSIKSKRRSEIVIMPPKNYGKNFPKCE